MLQTTVDATGSIPLFGTSFASPGGPFSMLSSSSSCGTEERQQRRLVIERPVSCDTSYSFDWSDFPVPTEPQDSFPVSSSSSSMFERNHDGVGESSTAYDSSSSFGSLTSNDSFSVTSSSSNADGDDKSSSRRRKVNFQERIEVRTHTIVLGDHPCCHGDLPIELGWEYNQSSGVLNSTSFDYTRRRRPGARRRSYLERKDLLKRLAGMTDDEIQNAITSAPLSPSGTSSRDLTSLMM